MMNWLTWFWKQRCPTTCKLETQESQWGNSFKSEGLRTNGLKPREDEMSQLKHADRKQRGANSSFLRHFYSGPPRTG